MSLEIQTKTSISNLKAQLLTEELFNPVPWLNYFYINYIVSLIALVLCLEDFLLSCIKLSGITTKNFTPNDFLWKIFRVKSLYLNLLLWAHLWALWCQDPCFLDSSAKGHTDDGLEHLFSEKGLESFQGNVINAHKYLKWEHKKDGARLFHWQDRRKQWRIIWIPIILTRLGFVRRWCLVMGDTRLCMSGSERAYR